MAPIATVVSTFVSQFHLSHFSLFFRVFLPDISRSLIDLVEVLRPITRRKIDQF